MTDAATRMLALVGRRGTVPRWLRPALRRATGFDDAICRRPTLEAALALDDVTVPYGPVSSLLGLGAFPLSIDGPDHQPARARIGQVLGATAAAHAAGVDVAAAHARATLEATRSTGASLDVIGGLVDPCLHRWVERWFGLPAMGSDLLATSRLITHAIFFNPASPRRPTDTAALARAVEASASQRVAVAEVADDAPPGTVAHALLEHGGGPQRAAADIVGLTVGPLTLGSWALTGVLVDLLEQPPGLDQLTERPDAARAYREALSRRPPLPGVPRRSARPRRVPGASKPVEVAAGHVLVATAAAARLDPPPAGGADGLPFGAGPHRCLGVDQITDVSAALIAELARHRPRLPIGGPRTPQAGRLRIDLDPRAA